MSKKDNERTVNKAIIGIFLIAVLTIAASCEYNPSPDPNNVVFDKISPTWTQEEAINKVKLALLQLSTQSQNLRSQYTEWETQLRSELKDNSDYEKIKQISFANSVQGIEASLSGAFQRNYMDTIKYYAGYYLANLIDAIGDFKEDQNGAALFKAQAQAFLMAHYLNQREYYASESEKASKQAEFAELAAAVERLGGGQRIPLDSMYGAIAVLENQLRMSLSRDYGEHRSGFIQQFEDYAQFDGWTDDLRTLGYSLANIPRSVLLTSHNFGGVR